MKILIAGASGHALEVLDVVLETVEIYNICFFDDITEKGKLLGKFLVLKDQNEARAWFEENSNFCLGIGGPKSRKKLSEKLINSGGNLIGIRASSAVISKHLLSIDPTVDILNLAFIGNNTSIGSGTLINTGAQVHHDVNIGVFCEVSPGAKLLGRVNIGDYCSIGTGATILPDVNVCNEVIVGAGAVVTKSITTPGKYVGVPARRIQ